MANPPRVVNQKPVEGTQDLNPEGLLLFGLRDVDTRVNLSSLYSCLLYARAVYRPDVLPDDDARLNSENIKTAFSIFNDAAGAVLPLNPADQSIQNVFLDKVYRVERTIAAPQEGFRYITDEIVGPVSGATAHLTLPVFSTSPTPYTTYPDFVGVMFGFVYWPRKTGIFLFFRDAGGVKSITVAGPSVDGIGTRLVEATILFDWAIDAYVYKVIWDESDTRKKILVLAVDSLDQETLLADIPIAFLNEFLPSVVLGGDSAADPPNRVALVVGTDGATPGDYIDVYKADLFRFGKPVAIEGGTTASAEVQSLPVPLSRVEEVGDLENWAEEGAGTTAPGIRLSRSGAPDVYRQVLQEPDLEKGEWLLIASLAGSSASHVGSFETGMGLDVEDGTNILSLRFLDDFVAKDVGIFVKNPAWFPRSAADSYERPSTPFDWSSPFQLILAGSLAQNVLRAYLNDDETPAIDIPYSSFLASPEGKLSMGFLDTDAEYDGTLLVEYLRLFHDCTFHAPLAFPEALGWSRVSFAAARYFDTHLFLDDTSSGAYDIYHLSKPDYDETSGAVIFLKGRVHSWVDVGGAASPPRKEIGPIAAIQTGPRMVQLFFVESEDGKRYAYLPGSDTDVYEVLGRSAQGLAISADLDFEEEHVYLLEVRPFCYYRLYIDYQAEPIIEIPWASKGIAERLPPTNMPPAASLAIGSLGESSGVKVELAFFRAAFGTGYDVRIQPRFSDEELNAHIYGSEQVLALDFEDQDP